MITLSINTSKIDRTALYEGKTAKFLDLALFANRDGVDQYGNDGFVVQSLPRHRRDAGERGPIVGNWKYMADKGAGGPRGGRSEASMGAGQGGVCEEPEGQEGTLDDENLPF